MPPKSHYRYKMFYYKFGIIWIGWVIIYREEDELYYADNMPVFDMKQISKAYKACIALTEKGILKKLNKITEEI